MKILYLTPGVFDKGGISRYNRYQISALRDIVGTHNVKVVSLLGPTHSRKDFETPFAVNWHGNSHGKGINHKIGYIAASLRLALRQRPSLIWTAHVHYVGLAQALAKLSSATVVLQVYGSETWTRRSGRPDIPWGIRRSDHVVSDAYFTLEHLKQNGLAPLGKCEVMWDPVDTEQLTPGKPNPAILEKYHISAAEHHFNILTLGRLQIGTLYKGYGRLLEIFSLLPQNCRLIYAGGGDLQSVLQLRAQKMGVADRVVFTGFIDEADLCDIYRSASVFCLIGERGNGKGEGVPLTPLEAAACGTPVLVGNQDGSREAVEHGITGFALEPFDFHEIASHIGQLIRDKQLQRSMGHAGRLKVERDHSYPVFRTHHSQFLDNIA